MLNLVGYSNSKTSFVFPLFIVFFCVCVSRNNSVVDALKKIRNKKSQAA